MSDNKKPTDYTKTKFFVFVDLTSRVLSALALVALGVAGWMLQSRTEDARETAAHFETQERRYLPMLRSLSVLELELESAAKELEEQRGQSEEGRYREICYNIGTKLRFVAESVFVPDGDPLVLLQPPGQVSGDKQIHMPLRASAIMCAELLKSQPVTFMYKNAPVRLNSQRRFLEMENFRLTVSLDSFPAWQTWIQDSPVKVWQMLFSINMLLQDLRFGASETIQRVLISHVDLGDRYVQIRDEVERSRLSPTSGGTPSKSSQ
jgi:hypothetical protein